MSLPTAAELATLDYAFQGQPFVHVAATTSTDTTTLDFAYAGEPFYGAGASAGGAGSTAGMAAFFQLF